MKGKKEMNETYVTAKCDWITATYQLMLIYQDEWELNDWVKAHLDVVERDLKSFDFVWEMQPKPPKFYLCDVRCLRTGIIVSIPLPSTRQGIRIVATGGQFKGEYQILAEELLQAEWKATRVDLAWDVFDVGEEVVEFADMWWERHGKTSKKRSQLISSVSGATFNIGSRSSQKYVRIYDKALEQGLISDWKRLEIELKADWATWGMEVVSQGVWTGALTTLDFIDLDESAIVDSIRLRCSFDEQIVPIELPRLVTNREKWFREQVIPAFRKLSKEDVEIARDILAILKLAISGSDF